MQTREVRVGNLVNILPGSLKDELTKFKERRDGKLSESNCLEYSPNPSN